MSNYCADCGQRIGLGEIHECRRDKKYKPFSEQFRECDKAGNIFRLTCPLCDRIIIVCQKHKTWCHSKACLNERWGN